MAGYREVQLVHTAVTVGATSVVALAANADRSYVKFYNDSDAVIYLKFGATAVANEGRSVISQRLEILLLLVASSCFAGGLVGVLLFCKQLQLLQSLLL